MRPALALTALALTALALTALAASPPAAEEKPELVARVNWSGVGVGMRTNSPSPARLRAAVRRVLEEPSFACRALAMQDEMVRYAGAARAADLVEGLIRGAVPS